MSVLTEGQTKDEDGRSEREGRELDDKQRRKHTGRRRADTRRQAVGPRRKSQRVAVAMLIVVRAWASRAPFYSPALIWLVGLVKGIGWALNSCPRAVFRCWPFVLAASSSRAFLCFLVYLFLASVFLLCFRNISIPVLFLSQLLFCFIKCYCNCYCVCA